MALIQPDNVLKHTNFFPLALKSPFTDTVILTWGYYQKQRVTVIIREPETLIFWRERVINLNPKFKRLLETKYE